MQNVSEELLDLQYDVRFPCARSAVHQPAQRVSEIHFAIRSVSELLHHALGHFLDGLELLLVENSLPFFVDLGLLLVEPDLDVSGGGGDELRERRGALLRVLKLRIHVLALLRRSRSGQDLLQRLWFDEARHCSSFPV